MTLSNPTPSTATRSGAQPKKPTRRVKGVPKPLRFVADPKGKQLPFRMSRKDYARLEALAAKSAITIERWLDAVIANAMGDDERHWAEMDEREAIRTQIDRSKFATLSTQLRNLQPGTVDVLVDALVSEREKGREEGSDSARRLAVCRVSRIA